MKRTPLKKYAERIVRLERLKMLKAPQAIIEKEFDLIRRSEKEVGHVPLEKIAKAIEDEIIEIIRADFSCASCSNCANFDPLSCHSALGICSKCSKFDLETESCSIQMGGKELCEDPISACDKYVLDTGFVLGSLDVTLLERLTKKYPINVEKISTASGNICSKLLTSVIERERSKN